LLNRCIEKFQQETGKDIIQNTNRKNYEGLAIILSEISNQLPFTSEKLGHQPYDADANIGNTSYPFRKYDITGGQIKDSLLGLVASPRPFLVDTCYIYVYGMGRQAFELSLPDDFWFKSKSRMQALRIVSRYCRKISNLKYRFQNGSLNQANKTILYYLESKNGK